MDRMDRMTGKGNASGDARHYPNSRLRQPGHMQPQPQPPQGSSGNMGSSSSVRDFFRERRELEAKGGYMPPINHHYKQAKGRTGSGNSFKKSSAGIDRAQPLAPIQARHSGISSAPAETPFNNKPRLVKAHHNNRRDDNNNDPFGDGHGNGTPPNRTPVRGAPPGKKPSPKTAPGGTGSKRSSGERDEKLSDFQKWQLEQTRAREDRLKKLNMRGPRSARESGEWERDEGGGGDYKEQEEQQLLSRIAAQQAELDRLRREREEEEEMVSLGLVT